jgi:hypothetical protein
VTCVAALTLAGTATACADGAGGASDIRDPIDVAEVGVTAMAQADVMACQADHVTLETAIEAFTTLNGAPPASEAELVGDWLREPSTLWDLDAAGALVPAPGSGC